MTSALIVGAIISYVRHTVAKSSDCYTIKYGHIMHTLDLPVSACNMAVNGLAILRLSQLCGVRVHLHLPVLSSCQGL